MTDGAEIHNGVIVAEAPGVSSSLLPIDLPAKEPAKDLSPDDIAAAMAREITSWLMDSGEVKTPMELVNRLLQLQDTKQQKLLFTRWDLFQCFAIWTRKLQGQDRVPGQGSGV